ncbi:hypothetical protein FXF51_08630 [Nonomuraea sp. PA05]|uniref:hypothetical protein n=1 Tax=Nonomuraea sp. PA05 TaxID=2604466 RepID=UPI0011D5DD8C|nr:hypothetical protein [Nonomuraea sp. PA05]TYB69280.1 hypothetical protein FXF51_08630 [Nonomuraea sp. PA05]
MWRQRLHQTGLRIGLGLAMAGLLTTLAPEPLPARPAQAGVGAAQLSVTATQPNMSGYALTGGRPGTTALLQGQGPDPCGDGSGRSSCTPPPSPPEFEKINNPVLSTPPRRLLPEEIEQAGTVIYGEGLKVLGEHLQAMHPAARGNFTVVLTEALVETEHSPVPRFIAFTSQAGIPQDLNARLTKLSFIIYKASAALPRSVEGHAERAAAGLRQNVPAQTRDLGGRITNVVSAFSTVQICSRACAGRLNKFIGDPRKNVQPTTNGMIAGTQIDKEFLRKARGFFGVRGLVATAVASQAFFAGFFRGRGGSSGRVRGR